MRVGYSPLEPLVLNNQRMLDDVDQRVLYRIYRALACRLQQISYEQLFDQILNRYSASMKYSTVLDLNLAFTDTCFYRDYSDMTLRLLRMGEALEAVGSFEEAANIYQYVARNRDRLSREEDQPDSLIQQFTGLAYKRCGLHDKAELFYLKALRADLQEQGGATQEGRLSWDVNNEKTGGLWDNLIVNDTSWAQQQPTSAASKRLAVLVGLLYAAKYRPHDHSEWIVQELGAKMRSVLLTKCVRSTNAAESTLASIVQRSEDVDQFHGLLMSCAKEGKQVVIKFNLPPPEPSKILHKHAKTAARENIQSVRNQLPSFDYSSCNNPASCLEKVHADRKLLQCVRCKSAQYCSKECQVAHWKVHKKVCKLMTE